MHDFCRRFENLRDDWIDARQKAIKAELKSAPRLNIITLLGLERSEVGLHSPILCDLLDPYGTHGQGALFLKSFLKLLGIENSWIDEIEDIPPPGEWDVVAERERIDITIENSKRKLLVFVENKIDALEGHEQLKRYGKKLDAQSDRFAIRKLVFLTPRSYDKKPSRKPDQHLLYEDNMLPWLQQNSAQIQAPNVSSLVDQYAAVLDGLGSTKGIDLMNEDMESLLLKPENIECALEISAAVQELRKRLMRRFWNSVEKNLSGFLSEWRLDSKWHARNDVRDNPDEFNVGVFASADGDAPNFIKVGLWREKSGPGRRIRLCAGIAFHNKLSKQDAPPEVEILRSKLSECDWNQGRMDSKWWIAGEFRDPDLTEIAGRDIDLVTRPLAELPARLLQDYLDLVETADQALRRRGRRP